MEFDKTMNFKVDKESTNQTREILREVYEALVEKGYNPINQLVGYILSGDPTYITSHNNARNKIRTIERDELLEKINALNEKLDALMNSTAKQATTPAAPAAAKDVKVNAY